MQGKVQRQTPLPGQESVWDYPRPPRVEPTSKRIRVIFNGVTIADSTRAFRVLETSHPPVYYLPVEDVRMLFLRKTDRETLCEFKGLAAYFTIAVGDKTAANAAWCYPDPTEGYEAIRDHIAFYPGRMEACYVDEEKVQAQDGDFYGGWITSEIVGPFKGSAGTWGW
ncbi:MAG: DUF427 domain-containing protein [Anaerolineae bacterium]|nr:DUF427 domain-containing protein [Anaerolineae bacterium]